MVGDVTGKSLLHLQCHFGIDTLSWARLGARVTGADISPSAVELARSLAVELGFPEARFVESNLYDLPSALDGEFDVVYTSRGVLGWLPDIRAWARVVARYVAPGGLFFITEAHPVMNVFENEGVAPGELRLTYPYWEHETRAHLPGHGLLRRPGRGRRRRDRALVGPRPRRDRDRPHRRRAGRREARRAPVPRLEGRLPRRGRRRVGGSCHPDAGGELPLMFSLVARKPV